MVENRDHKAKHLFILFAFCLFGLSSFSSLQEKQQESPGFQQRVRVYYQLTDFKVRNVEGKLVHGLGKDDFELFVDGEKIKIDSLEEFKTVSRTSSEFRNYAKLLTDAKKSNKSDLPEPPVPARIIIMVFDRFNMGDKGFARSKDLAKNFITHFLLPYDQVSIYFFDGELHRMCPLTSDGQLLLNSIDSQPTKGKDIMFRVSEFDIRPPEDKADALERISRARVRMDKFEKFLESIKYLGVIYATMPGMKNIVLFTEGPNIYASHVREKADSDEGYNSANYILGRIESTAKFLGSMSISLNTIARNTISSSWESSLDLDIGEGKRIIAFDQIEERKFLLDDLARANNGRFFGAEKNDSEVFNGLLEEISNYYVIGFVPVSYDRNDYQKIEIRAKNPEYHVQHRLGFLNRSPAEIINPLDLHAMGVRLKLDQGNFGLMTVNLSTKNIRIDEKNTYLLELSFQNLGKDKAVLYEENIQLTFDKSKTLPRRLWKTFSIPLTGDDCIVSVSAYDAVSGENSKCMVAFRSSPDSSNKLQIQGRILINDDQGNLDSWQAVSDKKQSMFDNEDNMLKALSKMQITSSLKQGNNVLLMLLIRGVDKSALATQTSLNADFVLNYGSDKQYRLRWQNGQIFQISDGNLLGYVELPHGLAQQQKGLLTVILKGLMDEKSVYVQFPYEISDFDEEYAARLLKNPAIEKY